MTHEAMKREPSCAHAFDLDGRRAASVTLLPEQPLELLALMTGHTDERLDGLSDQLTIAIPEYALERRIRQPHDHARRIHQHHALTHGLENARLRAQNVSLRALLRHFRDVDDRTQHLVAGLHGTHAHLQTAQLVCGIGKDLLEIFRTAGVDHALEDVVHAGTIFRWRELFHRRAEPRIRRHARDGSIQEHAFALAIEQGQHVRGTFRDGK